MQQCEKLKQSTSWSKNTTDGLVIRGLHHFQPSQTIIHFLPGTGFCGRLYWPFLREFMEGCGLFLQDYQGHGDSDNGEEYAGWQLSLQRCEQIIEHFKLATQGPLVGMGHSYGGVMTAMLAARRPELFSALLLLDPILLPEEMGNTEIDMPNPMAQRTRQRQQTWSSAAEALHYFQQKSMFKSWHPDALQSYVDHALQPQSDLSVHLKCPPHIEAGIYEDRMSEMWSDFRRLTVPTVIMYGQNSYPMIPPGVRKLESLNNNIQAIELSGGHNFMQEKPAQSAQIARQALADLGLL